MTLLEKQKKFVYLIGKLIEWSYANGYELTFGDAYRDPRVHGAIGEKKGYSHPSSVHKYRLACDFNLFVQGIWQQSSEAFRPLGEYWESLDSNCRWGGHFDDGNHFSFEHNGVK
ncbi:MAG: hypothetical protein AM326_09300 [Candidatus Thorarchaeota archaeon SMTZ-45]|nr:MAG: hypothetical protein AM326_09300 [Candidatus Thorarchaeota archaeon SMTZ-45]